MENFKIQLRTKLSTLLLFLSVSLMHAQVKDIGSVMSQWNTYIKSGSEQLFVFVSIICVLIGAIQLVIIYPKFSGGDQHSASAFLKHGGGLILVIVLLNLFKLLM